MTRRLILFGSGGHAKVVLEAYFAACPDGEIALIDDDPKAAGKIVIGHPVRGSRDWLKENWPGVGVLPAIGNNKARAAIMTELEAGGRRLETVVHPGATVSPSATIGGGCFLAAGSVVNAEARLGDGAIVNTCASVDHDCDIGRAAHIAPGARLCGTVQVGERTLVGVGAAVIPGIRIGSDTIIGAGSTVVVDVPDGVTQAGCPARPLDSIRTG